MSDALTSELSLKTSNRDHRDLPGADKGKSNVSGDQFDKEVKGFFHVPNKETDCHHRL